MLTAGIGDDILLMGARVSRYADEVAEGVEFAAKHADELGDAARVTTKHSDELVDAATWTARHGDDLAGEARVAQRLDDYVTHSDDAADAFAVERRADDYVVHSDDTARLADDFGNVCRGNSFTAGTPVETDDGPKPIEEIREGDKVLAEDPETGEQGYFEVVALTNHPTDEILHVTITANAEAVTAEQENNGDSNPEESQDDDTNQDVMEITPEQPGGAEARRFFAIQ